MQDNPQSGFRNLKLAGLLGCGAAALGYRFVHALCFLLGALFWKCRAFGRGKVPATGAVLIASNHQSFLDPVLVATCIPGQVRQVARETLFRSRLLAAALNLFGTIPIRRGEADLGALREAVKRLEQGKKLLVFPEGTRTPDGRLGPARGGVGLLATRTSVPVVPCLVQGTFECWPKGQCFPRCGSVRIYFDTPFRAEEGDPPRRIAERIEEAWRRLERRHRERLDRKVKP